jgi:hypothetical protein
MPLELERKNVEIHQETNSRRFPRSDRQVENTCRIATMISRIGKHDQTQSGFGVHNAMEAIHD